MEPTNRYAEASQKLTAALELQLEPIAISITDRVPAGVPTHRGGAPAGCSFWEQAAQGAFATVPADHESCTVGMHTHGMTLESEAQQQDLSVSLRVFNDLGYVRTSDVAAIPTLDAGTQVVVYSRLSSAPLPPNVVLVFASSRQGLIVTEAAQQLEGGVPPALGRPACAIVPQSMRTGRAALSLGCCGARAYLDVFSDDVALWALPGSRLFDYVERIEVLANANRTLTSFHRLRRSDVEAGEHPSVADSLARLQASS